jgi:hypothetical protein
MGGKSRKSFGRTWVPLLPRPRWRTLVRRHSSPWSRPRTRRYTWRRRGSWARCRRWRWEGYRRWRHVSYERGRDINGNWRACFKEADGRMAELRRLVRIKPEIIQCPPANSIGVRILRQSFRAPSRRGGQEILSKKPGSAAISSVAYGTNMCPSGMLGRRMKFDIAQGWGCKSEVNGRSARR